MEVFILATNSIHFIYIAHFTHEKVSKVLQTAHYPMDRWEIVPADSVLLFTLFCPLFYWSAKPNWVLASLQTKTCKGTNHSTKLKLDTCLNGTLKAISNNKNVYHYINYCICNNTCVKYGFIYLNCIIVKCKREHWLTRTGQTGATHSHFHIEQISVTLNGLMIHLQNLVQCNYMSCWVDILG